MGSPWKILMRKPKATSTISVVSWTTAPEATCQRVLHWGSCVTNRSRQTGKAQTLPLHPMIDPACHHIPSAMPHLLLCLPSRNSSPSPWIKPTFALSFGSKTPIQHADCMVFMKLSWILQAWHLFLLFSTQTMPFSMLNHLPRWFLTFHSYRMAPSQICVFSCFFMAPSALHPTRQHRV